MGSRRRRPRWGDAAVLDVETSGQWVIVKVSGEIDVAAVPPLRAALDPDSFPGGRTHLAVDLSGVTFCDSSGVGALVGAYRKLRDRNGQLVLLHTPDLLARQLAMTGVDRILPTRDTLDPGHGPTN